MEFKVFLIVPKDFQTFQIKFLLGFLNTHHKIRVNCVPLVTKSGIALNSLILCLSTFSLKTEEMSYTKTLCSDFFIIANISRVKSLEETQGCWGAYQDINQKIWVLPWSSGKSLFP